MRQYLATVHPIGEAFEAPSDGWQMVKPLHASDILGDTSEPTEAYVVVVWTKEAEPEGEAAE